MTKKLTLLVGVSMLAAAGLGYAASHENRGTMTTLDSIEWQEMAPGSPVSVAVLWGDPSAGASVRLIRDNVVVHEGKLSQLKRFKDDVKEVTAGQECGMAFENYQDMRQGDVIECYRVETIQRSL